LKWRYSEWFIAVDGQLPIHQQLLFMYLNPCLHHFELFGWQLPIQNAAIL